MDKLYCIVGTVACTCLYILYVLFTINNYGRTAVSYFFAVKYLILLNTSKYV